MTEQELKTIVKHAKDIQLAELRESALESCRLLNDIDSNDQIISNPEYLRGQVELIADIFGDGNGEYTDARYGIYAELGVTETF